MSFGKMNTFISIITNQPTKDADGFVTEGEHVLVSVRGYKEERHGTERWANRALFSSATTLFRFRKIPNITVTTEMIILCAGQRYNIVSAEDIKNRGMYVEVLCEEVKPSG